MSINNDSLSRSVKSRRVAPESALSSGSAFRLLMAQRVHRLTRCRFVGMAGSTPTMAMRERVSVDLDAEVAAILRKHAAEAHVSEGEILDRAVRAYDLRALLAGLQAKSEPRRRSGDGARTRGAEGRPHGPSRRRLMRVVADANVFVSAALGRSPQAPSVRIINAALDGRVELVMSPALLAEIADVLSRLWIRKRISAEDAQLFLGDVVAQAVMFAELGPPSERLPRSRRRLPGCADGDGQRRGARKWR